MKALRITLYLITGIVLLFFSLGVIVPSYVYQSSIVVNASPEKCWAAYHDTKEMAERLEGFESLTLKSGELLSPGSMYEIVVNDKGRRMVMSEKIMEIIAPNKISYELNNDVSRSEFSFSFEGIASTTITSKCKISGNSILWKSILFLSKSFTVNAVPQQFEGLKKVIEKQ